MALHAVDGDAVILPEVVVDALVYVVDAHLAEKVRAGGGLCGEHFFNLFPAHAHAVVCDRNL